MAIEIERKFLVKEIPWQESTHWVDIAQGYLTMDPRSTVRVRFEKSLRDGSPVERGLITIKGLPRGISRDEFEYEVPIRDAAIMLSGMCSLLVNKRRWFVQHYGHEWHVDQYRGDNAPLIVAELELNDENETWERPGWLGDEVTHDTRYINSNLAVNPWSSWRTVDNRDTAG